MTLTFPLAGADLESTGTDTETDRIVQAGFGRSDAPGDWSSFARLVDPGIPIPPAATEVHHITDEMVAGELEEGLAARDMVRCLYQVWDQDGIVVGTNICFDLTMLDRASRRGGFDGLEVRGPVIDTYVLDKAVDRYRKGSRKLDATCAHWGVPLDNAHDAEADLHAACRLAWVLVSKSPILRGRTMEELHEYQRRAYVEQKTSLYSYFDRMGIEYTPEPMDWPIRPWRGEEAA